MATNTNDMKAWLVQKNAENSFLVRVNMVELRGSARSQAFASSRDDTFKTLREKIALKVGRPDEACFIAATVRVAYRFGNLSATSSTAVDPRSRAPHDHECVYSTLEALRLQHHGAEVTVVARDRSQYGRVMLHDDDDERAHASSASGSKGTNATKPRRAVSSENLGSQNESTLDNRNSVANAVDDFNGSAEYATTARQGALEVLTRDCGGELPTTADGETPASSSSSSSAASNSATSQAGDAPSEQSLNNGSSSSGSGSAYVGGGAAAARALFADALSRSILGATVLLSPPPEEDFGSAGKLSTNNNNNSARSNGGGWSFLKGSIFGGSSAEPGVRMAPHAAWCMTDGHTLWFAPNPQGLAVPGQGHAAQAAGEQQLRDHEEQRAAARRKVSHMVGTSASAKAAALHALPAAHPVGPAAGRFNDVPKYRANGGGLDCGCLRAVELDRCTEIRVTFAGAVLVDCKQQKALRESESSLSSNHHSTSSRGAGSGGNSGGYPPPPKSQGYTLQVVSHAGARAGVEPRVYSQRCASMRAAAAVGASPTSANRSMGNSANGPYAVPARFGGSTGNSNHNSSSGDGSSSSNPAGSGSDRTRAGSAEASGKARGASASCSDTSADSGLVVLTIELGPEATALDFGDWVKALTAGRATTKFQHTTPEFTRPLPPRPPPQVSNLYGLSRLGSEATSSSSSSLLPVGRGRSTTSSSSADDGSSSSSSSSVGVDSGDCDDLMAACDAAIASSAKHESVRDAAIMAEASLGLPGTLRHQPLRSAFKRKLSSAVRDENLLFWAHARDYAHGYDRRSQHLPSSANANHNGSSSKTSIPAAGAAVGLDDLVDSTIVEEEEEDSLDDDRSAPSSSAATANSQPALPDDAAFEAAAALVCSETCALYLDPSGERRVSGLSKGPDEIELRRVLRVSAECQLALQAAKVAGLKKNGASSGSGASSSASPPPLPQAASSSDSRGGRRGSAQPIASRTCSACTFRNEDPAATACSMCDAPLPPPAKLPLKPPPPPGRGGVHGAQSTSTGTGFGRDNPDAGSLFAELASALLRTLEEAGEDWAEFSALGNPMYRKLLRAVPAHARAARRGQANPLAPRVPPSVDKARRLGDAGEVATEAEKPPFGWWYSGAGGDDDDGAAAFDGGRGSNIDTVGELRSGGLAQSFQGNFGLSGVKGSSAARPGRLDRRAQSALQLDMTSAAAGSPQGARAISTDGPKRPGMSRTMSSRFFGSSGNSKAARFEQAMKAEADLIEAQIKSKREAEERRAAAAPTLAQLEERWRLSFSNGSSISTSAITSSPATGSLFYATCPGSVGDFHSAQRSVALRLRAGFLGDANAWPEDCAGPHALAMLEGNAKLAQAASAAQEPPSSEAAARVERWWAAAVDDMALLGACRRVSAQWANGVLPKWLPCLLLGESAQGVVAGGGWKEAGVRTALARRYFESDSKRRHALAQAAWETALATTTSTISSVSNGNSSSSSSSSGAQYAWVRSLEPPCAVSGGEASGGAGTWPWALGGPLHPLASNALELPGTPLLWAPCRAAWRPRANEWSSSSQLDTRLSSYSSYNRSGSGTDAESWISSERLNNWSSFVAVAASYLMVLVEVAESAPLAVAAAHAGFPHLAAGSNNSSNNRNGSSSSSGSSSSGKVALLCFLREGSGVVERVVHLRDLSWIAPAVKPLHALALGDAFGECGLVLLNEGLGFTPGHSSGSGGAGSGGASAAGSSSSSSALSHGDSSGGAGGSTNSSGSAVSGSVRDSLLACTARDVWLQALAKAGGARPAGALNRSPPSPTNSAREGAASSSSSSSSSSNAGISFGGGSYHGNGNGGAGNSSSSKGPLVRPSLYEGVVRKKGGGPLVVRWQGRYFTLDASANMMRYYDDSTGEAKGNIPVETIEYVTPGTDCYFTIVSRPGEVKKTTSKDKATRTWELQAATRAEMFDWVFALEHGLSLRRAALKAQQAISSQASTAKVTIASGGAGRAAPGRGGPSRPGGSGRSTAN